MTRSSRRWPIVLFGALLCALALLLPARAHAQTCSATVSPISFGVVSPITRQPVGGSGTISVTCNWTVVSLAPTALVCLNLTAAQPRTMAMAGGSATMQYDLYSDQAHTIAWGSAAAGTTPISVSVSQPLLGTSNTVTFPYYGLIAANQPTLPTAGNGDTSYSHSFGASETSLTYGYYLLGLLGPPGCSSMTTSGGGFTFAASATVTNNCSIGATDLVFPSSGLLTKSLTATGTITAQCTNGDAYRISLSGGATGLPASRKMTLAGGTARVAYQIYADAQNQTAWGDNTGGTTAVTGVGTGSTASYTMYGLVPVQSTPQPGNYSDSITATISF
ncbi:Csu type fimbrial protein [Paraburkholderia acidisoli]|uniref:Fimbrial major subunit CsuA/B family protein n=1 Tax=Paraburkholderia acidisoli TaxID=2571748 RepID=A0A7Z2GQM3_9BURK|nr:spore coat U domain-containing protein [Paraburkholderia acidisoli]QGZ65996.1 fimbrial major subunit CsuA/B family protein [Paraburkholderia acidisoli]